MLKLSKVYFPGLISLIGLLFMCIFYLINHIPHNYNALDVVWTTRKQLNEFASYYTKKNDVETLRRFRSIDFKGDKKEDSIKLVDFKILVKKLPLIKDTVNGIKVTFGKHATYQELIDVLDVCMKEYEDHALNFAPLGNEIYIIYPTTKIKTNLANQSMPK